MLSKEESPLQEEEEEDGSGTIVGLYLLAVTATGLLMRCTTPLDTGMSARTILATEAGPRGDWEEPFTMNDFTWAVGMVDTISHSI